MNCVNYFFENSSSVEKDFIISGRENISLPLLYRRVNNLAVWLRENVGENKKVILLSPNSSFFITVYLAVMKSGNAIVPLNPAIEKKGFEYIAGQTETDFAFVSAIVERRLKPGLKKVINEKGLSEILEIDHSNSSEIKLDYEPDRLAQIIYTSGSTALPKGVMLSHKNLIANTSSIVEYLELDKNDRMLVVLPFYYCYGLSLLHTHLRVGGSIVLNNNFMFLGSVLNDLKKYECTGFAGVPSHFQILLRKSDSFIKGKFPSLKYVTQAGGKLHTVFIEEFIHYFPQVKFYVMYGQTEATARLSYLPPERLKEKMGSIGKGIPRVILDVFNNEGKPVAPDEPGEIVAQGDNIMLGYFKDKEATDAAIKNGWLYTGDLAIKDKEGFIYHLARKKEIVKVGGKRVSLKEIEEVIVSMTGVVDCTVEPVEDAVLGEAIKAIIVMNPDYQNVTERDVKEFCSKKLAPYKIPSIVEFDDKVKVNAAGKKVKQ
ncbi:MAG: AMP-binding protein [Chlorobi bacterium]|nr:AMP-binding protein [Chlorobiota bacterium]